MQFIDSLIIKKCIVGTLSLGLAGSGTNKFSALALENLKYRPLDDARSIAFLMIRLCCRYGVGSMSSVLLLHRGREVKRLET